MCHIKIEPLCQVEKIFNKNQEIYQQILSWSLTSKIWGNKGLSKSLVWWLHPSLNIKFSLQLFGFVLILRHESGKWGTDCLILTFLLGTIFTQVWRSGVTFFLMKQNQCLRRHFSANWSPLPTCLGFPHRRQYFSGYYLKIFLIAGVKIFHQHDFTVCSPPRSVPRLTGNGELQAIKIKYKKNVQFWTQLEKNRWIKKNLSVPNDKAPSQTEKEKFSSINLLTVIPLCWSLRKTTHQEASFWSSEPWDKSLSLARILHQAPDTARQRLSFKICGEVVGRRSDRMEGAVIRYISNGSGWRDENIKISSH